MNYTIDRFDIFFLVCVFLAMFCAGLCVYIWHISRQFAKQRAVFLSTAAAAERERDTMKMQIAAFLSISRHRAELRSPITYDTLAPDWSNAPEWAQFYVVVPSGRAFWSETELEILPEGDGWRDKDEIGLLSLAGLVDLPLGIDWRLCKWQRPEVTA